MSVGIAETLRIDLLSDALLDELSIVIEDLVQILDLELLAGLVLGEHKDSHSKSIRGDLLPYVVVEGEIAFEYLEFSWKVLGLISLESSVRNF